MNEQFPIRIGYELTQFHVKEDGKRESESELTIGEYPGVGPVRSTLCIVAAFLSLRRVLTKSNLTFPQNYYYPSFFSSKFETDM